MKNLSRKFEGLFRGFIYVLPAVLFFSYYPIISFGSSESMNFELSLPLIWLVSFDLLAFIMMVRRKLLFRDFRKKWVWLLFPIYLTISVFWSLNSLRGILTVGILWLIYFAVDAFFSLRSLFLEVGFRERFWKAFFGSTILICLWCFLQCILDLNGVSRDASLMCAGCTYQMFGFPHPNGFSIEPQFMGNLLLAPAIAAAYMMLEDVRNSAFRGCRRSGPSLRAERGFVLGRNLRRSLKTLLPSILLFIISATLFLTFSRGAIYAFIVGMVGLTVFLAIKFKAERKMIWKRAGTTWLVIILAFLFTLNLQGIFAQVSPTNDTYRSGVAKALNHLSLGIVDIREDSGAKMEEVSEFSQALVSEKTEEEAVFSGYVAESTETRVRLTEVAGEVWAKDFSTIMFGVGLGGAGQALYINGLSSTPKEIIQNEYASLLLETGLVGILLLIFTVVLIIRVVYKDPAKEMIFALLICYAISVCFFSGFANALQIYLLPALMILLL